VPTSSPAPQGPERPDIGETTDWTAVRRLFDEVVELADAARTERLALSDVPAGVRREVQSLLMAHDQVGNRYDLSGAAPADPVGDHLAGGDTVGVYRLERRLGHGGMGSVWAARRNDGSADKRVAIKVIRSVLSSADGAQRFLQERRILGAMEHPHIATLIDAGTLADGRPWYAMEYVEGEAITSWADVRGLPIRRRLVLFLQLCDAVEYAHRQRVVHRDVKPANVLVTASGDAKLLDFGIARLLHIEPTDQTITRGSAAPFTPAYASPEQQRGEPISFASDLYSLGVLLYELLCGTLPLSLDGLSTAERLRRIEHDEPTAPSTRVSAETAARRGATADSLRRALAGDLDRIALMALAKVPGERYESAAHLGDDIRRYLDGAAVRAHAPSWRYRLARYVRRHRVGVRLSAVTVVVALAVTLKLRRDAGERTRMEREAVARADDVRALARVALTEASSLLNQSSLSAERRADLVRAALGRLDRATLNAQSSPMVARELARGYQQLGDVQGNPTQGANLGDLRGARETFERADSIMVALYRTDSTDANTRRVRALGLERLADVEAPLGDVALALRHQQWALSIYRDLSGDATSTSADALRVAIAFNKLGDLLGGPAFASLDRKSEARAAFDSSLSLLQKPPLDSDTSYAVSRMRAVLHERRGSLARESGDSAFARRELMQSLREREALADRYFSSVEVRRDYHISLYLACRLELDAGRLREAEALCQRSYRIRQQLFDSDPTNAAFVRSMALIHAALGDIARIDRRHAEARDAYARSAAAYGSYFGRGAGGSNDKRDRSTLSFHQAIVAVALGDRAGARALLAVGEATLAALPPALRPGRADSLARALARRAVGSDR
jgi:serine/threonine protein kinase